MNTRDACLLILCALAGCGDVNRVATDYAPSNNRVATAPDDTIPPPAPVVRGAAPPAAPRPPLRIDPTALVLRPVGASPVGGSGRLAPVGSLTSISVTLSQGTPGTTYEGAVRRGSCAAIGGTLASLAPISAGSSGDGRAVTHLPVPADRLLRGRYVVVYGKGGRPESCGSISAPAAPTSDPTAPPGGAGRSGASLPPEGGHLASVTRFP